MELRATWLRKNTLHDEEEGGSFRLHLLPYQAASGSVVSLNIAC
jgi:hypothetical protein